MKLSTKMKAAAVVLLCLIAVLAGSTPAQAKDNRPGGAPAKSSSILATSIWNNSPVGLGIVTQLGQPYAYVMLPGRWSPRDARGGYTGWGWCTNIYYDLGDGIWQYRFQIRGAQYWSVAYLYAAWVRADSWRC